LYLTGRQGKKQVNSVNSLMGAVLRSPEFGTFSDPCASLENPDFSENWHAIEQGVGYNYDDSNLLKDDRHAASD
jgi:hypothetical protein